MNIFRDHTAADAADAPLRLTSWDVLYLLAQCIMERCDAVAIGT